MLINLAGWRQRPSYLTAMAYELCSVISENYSGLADGKRLLFLSLETGFRHLDPKNSQISTKLVHTVHHERMVDVVFEGEDAEVIADLLHAWTSHSDSHKPSTSLNMCARHLVGLRLSSRRLRRLTIRAVGSIGYRGFERVGLEGFFKLLDRLQVGVGDIHSGKDWATLLLDTIKSSTGIQNLPHPYWDVLAELSVLEPQLLEGIAWSPHIMASLEGDKEWGRLECWMGVVWIVWPPETGSTTEEFVRSVMLSLFRERPGAILKLEQCVGQWSVKHGKAVPKTFQQICEQAGPEPTRPALATPYVSIDHPHRVPNLMRMCV